MDDLLDNIEPDDIPSVHLNPQYYNTDYINVGGFDVVLDDIFVKPIKKKIKKNKRKVLVIC